MVVMIQSDWMRASISSVSCQSGSSDKNSFSIAGSERREGAVQRVVAKTSRSVACAASSAYENSEDRNASTGTNRQFTVHLYRNCRFNWNERKT